MASCDCQCNSDRKRKTEEMEGDWLVGHAVLFLVIATIVGIAWQSPEGSTKLLYFFTVPNFTWLVLLVIILGFFGVSLLLSLASVVPPLRRRALDLVSANWYPIGFLGWFAFLMGWLPLVNDLPRDEWWFEVLLLGGVVLMILLPLRLLYRAFVRDILLGWLEGCAGWWGVSHREGSRRWRANRPTLGSAGTVGLLWRATAESYCGCPSWINIPTLPACLEPPTSED